MAKTHSVIKDIKAKPNERGRRSHLPLVCGCKNCEEDFYVSYPRSDMRADVKRRCKPHFDGATQKKREDKTVNMLRRLGLV